MPFYNLVSCFLWLLMNVFDQVLECFELQPDNDVFLELIPIFPKVDKNRSLGHPHI